MKEGIKEPGRGGCTVGSDEEWECSGERRDTENLFSAHNRSYTKKAVGPCSTEDRTHEHEQHNEMVCFLHTTTDKWKNMSMEIEQDLHTANRTKSLYSESSAVVLFITCGPHYV